MSFDLAHQQNALEKGANNSKSEFPQANEIQSYAETTEGDSEDEFHDCEEGSDAEETAQPVVEAPLSDPVRISYEAILSDSCFSSYEVYMLYLQHYSLSFTLSIIILEANKNGVLRNICTIKTL